MDADDADYADDSRSFRMGVFKKTGDFRSAGGEKPLQDVIRKHLRNLFHLRPSAIQTDVTPNFSPLISNAPVGKSA